MKFFTSERLGPKQSIMGASGFLLCEDVPLARTGVQLYGPGEVPITPGPDGMIRIEREPDQVFRSETVASANGKAATVDHPPVDVTPDNWRELAVGFAVNPRRGEGILDDLLLGDIIVTCPEVIEAVRARKLREISLGYDADYEEIEPGRGRQTNILVNHVAFLEPGGSRCGPRCSIGDARYTYHAGGFVVGRGEHATPEEALAAARSRYGDRAYVVDVETGRETRDDIVTRGYRTTDPPRRPRAVHVHVYR